MEDFLKYDDVSIKSNSEKTAQQTNNSNTKCKQSQLKYKNVVSIKTFWSPIDWETGKENWEKRDCALEQFSLIFVLVLRTEPIMESRSK